VTGPQPAFYTYQAPGGAATLGQRVIALTFDDGPGPYTPQVLSVLERYGVPATFFEVGDEVVQYPQYTRTLAAAGYPVEDHTWSHPDLATIPISQFPFQIDQTQNEIRSITGQTPVCVRPPYDAWNSTVLAQVAQRGLTTMSYSIDPRDWTLPGTANIVAGVVNAAFPGAVVGLHDGGGPRDETVAALPQIISQLRAQGYTFVSICGAPVPPTFTNATPPDRIAQGAGFAYGFTATGNPAPTFSVRLGTLPGGLTLTTSGVLAGVPTSSGVFTFTVAATNTGGVAVSGPVTMAVSPSVLVGAVAGGGRADLIGVNAGSSWVMLSSGHGYGAPQRWSSIPFHGTRATLVGDVNGDGRADLIGVNDGSTWVMLSSGHGYGAPQLWSATPFHGTRATLVGDVNGDGRADLIGVNDRSSWVMLSTGHGYGAPRLWSATPFHGSSATLVGDVNGDGRADLIGVNDRSSWVMLSTGHGYGAPQRWSATPFHGSRATLVGDVNGDGRADLIGVNDRSSWVMLSSGHGYGAPQRWSATPFHGSRATLVGDVNGDRRADLIGVNDNSSWVMLSSGHGYGAPQLWSTTPFFGTEPA
jgi:peptidoglycan/xylan/chitin deacetylase (PgdA/CDA1 family)